MILDMDTTNADFPYASSASRLTLDTFSKVAADWIRLRLALYGPEDAQRLIRRCYARSKADKINAHTVENEWARLDAEIDAANKALDAYEASA